MSYKVCRRCIMDTTASDIVFDAEGNCNYCSEVLQSSARHAVTDPGERQRRLEDFLAEVKAAGRGKPYDCIMGVSGGIDSSWALVKAVELGIRPLAVHMDNGWNSELAQNNIANLIRGLRVDLHTHVIDWEEYRQLMQAFFDADVIDVEILYDNAMLAVNYREAARRGLRHILAGSNTATEGIRFPPGWTWLKFDRRNIEAIGKRGGVRLRTFPAISTLAYLWYRVVRRIKWISFLDLLDYNKNEALEVLERDYGYKRYPYKHYESVFTRFYQGFILPTKFGVDKRRVHLSALVASGQMTRDEALRLAEGIAYPSQAALVEDQKYFTKKMGWTSDDLDSYIARPAKPHSDYPSERGRWDALAATYRRVAGR